MIPIFEVTYETNWQKPCKAIVAAESDKEAEGLLEFEVRNDKRIIESARTNSGFKMNKAEQTQYKSDIKGVIYF